MDTAPYGSRAFICSVQLSTRLHAIGPRLCKAGQMWIRMKMKIIMALLASMPRHHRRTRCLRRVRLSTYLFLFMRGDRRGGEGTWEIGERFNCCKDEERRGP